MAGLVGIAETRAQLLAAVAGLEKEAITLVQKDARYLMERLFARTPVWSGETVRNYVWSAGASRPSGGTKGAIGSGPIEPTSLLALGAESRRPANEAAARSDMESVIALTKLSDLSVTNLIDAAKWDLIDNGAAPTPASARNPGGVSKAAEQAVRAGGHWK